MKSVAKRVSLFVAAAVLLSFAGAAEAGDCKNVKFHFKNELSSKIKVRSVEIKGNDGTWTEDIANEQILTNHHYTTGGRNLNKLGQHAQDTAELFFDDVRVPVENLLGRHEGEGFTQLVANLPRERLSIAVAAVASVRSVLEMTLAYVKERRAFGKPVGTFQNSRFVLAEIATELDVAQHYVDDCVRALNDGELTEVDAAKAKWWTTELQGRALDRCLQLHGGYGFMNEYPVARAYADARVTRIYGGTTEIMKEVVGRDLGL